MLSFPNEVLIGKLRVLIAEVRHLGYAILEVYAPIGTVNDEPGFQKYDGLSVTQVPGLSRASVVYSKLNTKGFYEKEVIYVG